MKRGRKIKPFDEIKFRELRQSGLGYDKIAKLTGHTKSLIARYARILKINQRVNDGGRPIKNNRLQCCDSVSNSIDDNSIRVMSNSKRDKTTHIINRISKVKELMQKQNGRCIYCERKIGSPYIRKNKVRLLKPSLDHFAPYSLVRQNTPIVLACNLCNSSKSYIVFDTLELTKAYLQGKQAKRVAKGKLQFPDSNTIMTRLNCDSKAPSLKIDSPNEILGKLQFASNDTRLKHFYTVIDLDLQKLKQIEYKNSKITENSESHKSYFYLPNAKTPMQKT